MVCFLNLYENVRRKTNLFVNHHVRLILQSFFECKNVLVEKYVCRVAHNIIVYSSWFIVYS